MTTRMLHTYAYDGSGVALRCEVDVIENRGETATVSFVGFVPPLDTYAGDLDLGDGRRVVRTRCLTPTKSVAPLASFNFLD